MHVAAASGACDAEVTGGRSDLRAPLPLQPIERQYPTTTRYLAAYFLFCLLPGTHCHTEIGSCIPAQGWAGALEICQQSPTLVFAMCFCAHTLQPFGRRHGMRARRHDGFLQGHWQPAWGGHGDGSCRRNSHGGPLHLQPAVCGWSGMVEWDGYDCATHHCQQTPLSPRCLLPFCAHTSTHLCVQAPCLQGWFGPSCWSPSCSSAGPSSTYFLLPSSWAAP